MKLLRNAAKVCLFVSSASAATAAPATTTWTTYLYQGPGTRYSVVDEVPQATRLDDAQCSAGWCKVTLGNRTGFLLAEVVAFGNPAQAATGVLPQPAASLSPLPPPGPCVEANQTGGNGGNAMTIFCNK